MEQHLAPDPKPRPHYWPQLLVILLILSGVALTAFFGTRLLQSMAELHRIRVRPGETSVEMIRGWMTIPYISRAYRVPEDALWSGLGIQPERNRHKNLRALDQEFVNGQRDVILNKVKAIVSAYLAQHLPTATPIGRPRFNPTAP